MCVTSVSECGIFFFSFFKQHAIVEFRVPNEIAGGYWPLGNVMHCNITVYGLYCHSSI